MARYRNPYLDREELPTCLAPWHALTIKWGGKVIPDILYIGDSFGNVSNKPLSKILQSDKYKALRAAHRARTVPESCRTCAKKEKNGRSRRMYFWDKLDTEVREASVELDVDSIPDIRYLDFTLSNKCNLACIHCRPFVSSGWTKDGKALNREMPEYWQEEQVGYHGADAHFMDNLFDDPRIFRNLQWVALRGGEPLYDEKCIELLQWFVDQDLAKNIMLDISTNATVFKDEFMDLFSHFKHIELLVSVEATEELYSIVRGGPNTWADLEANIEKFYEVPNLEMVFATAVMNTTVFELDKIWAWFEENHMHRASISMSNVVVQPSQLNIAFLPKELKELALERIKSIPKETTWPAGSYHEHEFTYQTGIDDIIRGLEEEHSQEEQERNWRWFLQYTRDLDRLRGTNTLQYIPEIQEYVKSQQ